MCANSARLVDSLECYMDDLVDCFEDFVKKSLLIISIAVGALIIMLGYVLKLVTVRTQPSMISPEPLPGSVTGYVPPISVYDTVQGNNLNTNTKTVEKSRGGKVDEGPPQKSANSITVQSLKRDIRKISSAADTGSISSVPSFDEKVLKSIGLSSCSKGCMQSRRSIVRNCSTSRIGNSRMAACVPNHHVSTPRPCSKFAVTRNSCCSMCCAEEDRR